MNDIHLSAEVHIGSWNVTPWMVRVERTSTLCNPGEEFTITMEPSMPYAIVPNQEVTIWEQGTKVLTGFVTSVIRINGGEATIKVVGTDKYKLARDGFIVEDEWKSIGEDVDEWMSRLTERVGLEYISDNPSQFSKRYVAPETNFGLMGVGDAITLVQTYAGGYLYTDKNGRIHMRQGYRNEDFLHFAPGIYVESSGSTSGSYMSAAWEHSDKYTRDTAKVFGTAWNGQYYIPAESSIELGLPAHRTMVYATPMIQTYEEAKFLADKMIHEVGKFTDIYRFEIAGNPNVHIGRGVDWTVDYGNFPNSGSGIITNVESSIDEKGYVQVVTVNEVCPKIAGWQYGGECETLWIAAHARNTFDPRPEKLIWALTPVGFGMPTFHIVKDIPSGAICGMHPYRRAGQGVFLLMASQINPHYPPGNMAQLWFSENPTNQDPEWQLLLQEGDSLGGGYILKSTSLGMAIASMQTIGDTLYLGASGYDNTDQWGYFYGEYTAGVFTWTKVFTEGQGTVVGSRDSLFKPLGTNHTALKKAKEEGNWFDFYGATQFVDTQFWNGVAKYPVGSASPGVGGVWATDILGDNSFTIYNPTTSGGLSGRLIKDGTIVMAIDSTPAQVILRGDYQGSQVQFVFTTGPYSPYPGDLYIALDGSSYAKKFSWLAGIVNCLNYTDPSILAWMPITQTNANEIMRVSIDGGTTWRNMTGNWWGSHGEVSNGTAMQSDGGMSLIDMHPTFLM